MEICVIQSIFCKFQRPNIFCSTAADGYFSDICFKWSMTNLHSFRLSKNPSKVGEREVQHTHTWKAEHLNEFWSNYNLENITNNDRVACSVKSTRAHGSQKSKPGLSGKLVLRLWSFITSATHFSKRVWKKDLLPWMVLVEGPKCKRAEAGLTET